MPYVTALHEEDEEFLAAHELCFKKSTFTVTHSIEVHFDQHPATSYGE